MLVSLSDYGVKRVAPDLHDDDVAFASPSVRHCPSMSALFPNGSDRVTS